MDRSTDQALLVVSYGGPEQNEDVVPFIETVLAGKNVSRERIEQVAEKYYAFDGVSPLNEEVRRLISALLQKVNEPDKNTEQPIMKLVDAIPVYWGNLFWHPMLEETVTAMAADGIRKVIAFCTVPFASPESFQKYTDAIKKAVEKTGLSDFEIETTRLFFNHPLFVESVADRIVETLAHLIDWGNQLPPLNDREQILDQLPNKESIKILFTAHSLPVVDDKNHVYQRQLVETARLVGLSLESAFSWELAYQSRGGGPQNSWLGPDVSNFAKNGDGRQTLIVCPIGFMLENIELLYDLDHHFASLCETAKIRYLRTEPVGYSPKIITMIRELVAERLSPLYPRRSVGSDEFS